MVGSCSRALVNTSNQSSPAITSPNCSWYVHCPPQFFFPDPWIHADAGTYKQRYTVYQDPYHNIQRLDLFQFNGAPVNAMYLAYSPPQMLPTQTLNPTSTPKATGSTATSTANAKRSFEGPEEFREPLNKNALLPRKEPYNPDKWWWFGVGLTAVGSVGYFCF